jgi:hypothetical protein
MIVSIYLNNDKRQFKKKKKNKKKGTFSVFSIIHLLNTCNNIYPTNTILPLLSIRSFSTHMYGVGLFSVNCLRRCLSPAETRMIATFTRSSTLQRIQNTVTTFWMKGKKGKGKKKECESFAYHHFNN